MIEVISEYYNIPKNEILGKKQDRHIADARHMLCFLEDEIGNKTLYQIRDIIGYKGHAQVIHAIKNISNLIKTDSKIKKDYENIKEYILTSKTTLIRRIEELVPC